MAFLSQQLQRHLCDLREERLGETGPQKGRRHPEALHPHAHRAATLRWYQPAEQIELAKYFQRILVDPLRAEQPPRNP